MRVYSTCRTCDTLMDVHLGHGQREHPMCDPSPDIIDRLTAEFLAAAEAGDDAKADELEERLRALLLAPPRLMDAALRYADWGWAVFPLKPGEKVPATRNGFKDATTDADQIRRWWSDSASNIGLATGHRFDVLDIDFRHGAMPHWLELRDHGELTAHGIVVTWSGGLHVYLPDSGRGNGVRLGKCDGIDYRGAGGYVVAPPSVVYGKGYSWDVYPSPVLTRGE